MGHQILAHSEANHRVAGEARTEGVRLPSSSRELSLSISASKALLPSLQEWGPAIPAGPRSYPFELVQPGRRCAPA